MANLSKVFDLQKRRKGRSGLGSRELAAMVQLGRSVLRRGVRVGRRFYALSDINLEVGSGEIMGIIGRNGAGKSTLLKILARVLDPTEGSVRLEGRVASLLELGAGFNGDLTVSENISLHIALSGSKPDPDLEERILTLSELGDYRDIDLDDCPGGRVGAPFVRDFNQRQLRHRSGRRNAGRRRYEVQAALSRPHWPGA